MSAQAPRRKRTTRLALAGLFALMGGVVYSSLHVARFQCDVCISFAGRESCRTVEASTEAEARAGAVTNACAHLASGVTDSLACERTVPTRVECKSADSW